MSISYDSRPYYIWFDKIIRDQTEIRGHQTEQSLISITREYIKSNRDW